MSVCSSSASFPVAREAPSPVSDEDAKEDLARERRVTAGASLPGGRARGMGGTRGCTHRNDDDDDHHDDDVDDDDAGEGTRMVRGQ